MGAPDEPRADVVVVGAGAAGLMAGIFAARTAPGARVRIVDGAAKLGAKILISGGGRCNVTHHAVGAEAFAGSSPNAIRRVLRRFDVPETVRFFETLGVTLKREETGKLFPTTNRARTVLDALLGAATAAGAALVHPFRVETVTPDADGFVLAGPHGRMTARRVVLATGGRSVPQTGSDGRGYAIARSLGHTVTPQLQALVPLLLENGHPLLGLRGVSTDATLSVVTARGRGTTFTGSLLLTHFGLSGPVAMDVSRYWLAAREETPDARLEIGWLPGEDAGAADRWLRDLRATTPGRRLAERLPRRLADELCRMAGVDPDRAGDHVTKAERAALVSVLVDHALPVVGPRGWPYAEVTAGGVPLAELDLGTLASRVCPGLHLCGEICDVDGRIGGFNFQWAWASGFVAGTAVAR